LHRFFSTGDPTEVADRVFPFRSSKALSHEKQMLNSRVGFLVERSNNVSDYDFD
jgi:hypothetical protein